MLSNVAEAEKVSEVFKASNWFGKVHSVQKDCRRAKFLVLMLTCDIEEPTGDMLGNFSSD